MPVQDGGFLREDFYNLTGGLNTSDSPFLVEGTQHVAGQNFDYVTRGGVQKRPGQAKLMASADADLTTKGFALYDDFTTRTVFRGAGQHLKAISSLGGPAITLGSSITSDEASPSAAALATSTVPMVSATFTTSGAQTTWCGGSDVTNLVGIYSASKWTSNGVVAPVVSSFTATSVGSGGTLPAGVYEYTLTYVKASTGVESNALAATSEVAGTSVGTDKLTIKATLTGFDATKHSFINVYRSSIAGSSGFTGGVFVGQVGASHAALFASTGGVDNGTQWVFNSVTTAYQNTSANIPRAGNIVLDNSQLPAGKYNVLTRWKQRLVSANNSTVYISDVVKPESWPLTNVFQIPSAGKITALATVSLVSTTSSVGIDEALVIFKEREVWAVTGNDYTDWVLTRVDVCGCSNQPLVINAGGSLFWVSYQGVFTWNGSGKPRCLSQPIEDKFYLDGDINKSELIFGFGLYHQQRNTLRWFLSSYVSGIQKYELKLDLRLTSPTLVTNLITPVIAKGVFNEDVLNATAYGGIVFTVAPTSVSELVYFGDDTGFVYQTDTGYSDPGGNPIEFDYTTTQLSLGNPGSRKTLNKVVAWVQDNGLPSLSMDYWSDHKYADTDMSTAVATVSPTPGTDVARWDVALWDTAVWPSGTFKIKGVVFNPNSQTNNNASGTAFRIRFRESSNQYQPILYGFSVYYTESTTGF